jgi:hypothetical protein
MTQDPSQASVSRHFLLRRGPSSYYGVETRALDEAKRKVIDALVEGTEPADRKYHYGLFTDDTQSLAEAQAAFSKRLIARVSANLTQDCGLVGETWYRLGVQGASFATLDASSIQAVLPPRAETATQPSLEFVFVDVVNKPSTDDESLSESFDCLLIEGSYRSIDQLGFLSRARRLLKPGGSLVFFSEFLLDDSAVEHSPLPNWSSLLQLAERLNFSAAAEDHTLSALRSIDAFGKLAQEKQLPSDIDNIGRVLAEFDTAAHQLSSGKRAFKLVSLVKRQVSAEVDSEYASAEYGDRSSFQPAAIAALFESSFGHAFDAELWHWKYDLGAGRCVVARASADGDIVAHYGGAPRDIHYFGREALAIQPCDVMVMPEERTRYGRGSLFFKVAATFLEREIGNTVDHLLGFGFPNKKTMRLAIRLGLYEKTDDFVELRLPVSTTESTAQERGWTVAQFDAEDLSQRDEVDALWKAMQADFRDGIIGVRDWHYVSYRYLQHPHSARYVFHWLRDSTNKAMALIVIKRGEDAWLVMDIIAPLVAVPPALAALGAVLCSDLDAATQSPREIALWLTKGWVEALAIPNAQIRDLGIEIPCNSWNPGPPAELLYGKWWLTAGDMDFQ